MQIDGNNVVSKRKAMKINVRLNEQKMLKKRRIVSDLLLVRISQTYCVWMRRQTMEKRIKLHSHHQQQQQKRNQWNRLLCVPSIAVVFCSPFYVVFFLFALPFHRLSINKNRGKKGGGRRDKDGACEPSAEWHKLTECVCTHRGSYVQCVADLSIWRFSFCGSRSAFVKLLHNLMGWWCDILTRIHIIF